MQRYKLYKKKYEFCPFGDNYWKFLSAQLSELNPKFYSIIAKTKIDTTNGKMYLIKLKIDIENPNLEPIAECVINREKIYLWRDKCWAIAVNEHDCWQIHKDYRNPPKFDKIIIIYEI